MGISIVAHLAKNKNQMEIAAFMLDNSALSELE
jgi:hypothetical protein